MQHQKRNKAQEQKDSEKSTETTHPQEYLEEQFEKVQISRFKKHTSTLNVHGIQ